MPNKKENLDKIGSFKGIINDWAFKEFGGKLYIAISTIEISSKDLVDNFSVSWELLSDNLEKEKKQKFKWKLDYLFNESNLEIPLQWNNSQECQICHRDNIDLNQEKLYSVSRESYSDLKPINTNTQLDNESKDPTRLVLNELCFNLLLLGTQLKTARNIYRYNNLKSSTNEFIALPYLNYSISKIETAFYTLEKLPNIKPIHIWAINSSNDLKSTSFLIANYEAKDKPDTESLANASAGTKLIGCLRMDVDDLGKTLTQKLNPFNLETLSTFSNHLNYFFKIKLNEICKTYNSSITQKNTATGANVSVIYSGGDDLFIVGAWDEVVELSINIQKLFSEYFLRSVGFTLGISAGITLHKPDFPFYQMAKLSLEALETAKYEHKSKNRACFFFTRELAETDKGIRDNIYNGKVAKNGGFLLYESNKDLKRINLSLTWNEITTDVIPILKWFLRNYHSNNLKHSFFSKLFSIVNTWYEKESLFIPELLWVLQKTNTTDEYSTQFFHKIIVEKKINSLHIPLTWFEYLIREEHYDI